MRAIAARFSFFAVVGRIFGIACVLFAFCAGWFSDNCLKKRYQFAGENHSTARLHRLDSVPFASLGGEIAAIRVNKILLPPAIDAAREREGQIFSERCSCTIIARSSAVAHEITSMTDRVIERLKPRPLRHANSGSRSAAYPVSLGQCGQRRRMRRVHPTAGYLQGLRLKIKQLRLARLIRGSLCCCACVRVIR